MANEITTSQTALVNYNPGQASLLEMRADPVKFPRLNSMPYEQAVFEISKIVSQAFLYRGQAADPTNIKFISSALVTELMGDTKFGLPYISLAEIQVVVKRAVLGGSDMFGISVASLYKIILEFAKGEGQNNQRMVHEKQREMERRQLQDSPVSSLIDAHASQFIKNHKIK